MQYLTSAIAVLQKDPEALKELFRRVFMDYVFPLLDCASLPDFDLTQPLILQVGLRLMLVIIKYLYCSSQHCEIKKFFSYTIVAGTWHIIYKQI